MPNLGPSHLLEPSKETQRTWTPALGICYKLKVYSAEHSLQPQRKESLAPKQKSLWFRSTSETHVSGHNQNYLWWEKKKKDIFQAST